MSAERSPRTTLFEKFFFFQAEDGIRDKLVTGVQTCALPISVAVHLIRISDMVDSYRDLLSGSLDAYMSMVSNRLNDVMKQLTIIATVFLPLSFLTGFFGQNLGWLVNREGSLTAFLVFGIGTEVLA